MYVAVVGAADAPAEQLYIAEEIGYALAKAGAIVVTGGLGGVMEAASHGAAHAGGLTLGIIPGTDRAEANPWAKVVVPSGLGELRNGLVVRSADVVIAVGGGHGTLSEIALALKVGRPVIGIGTWAINGVTVVDSASAAVAEALRHDAS